VVLEDLDEIDLKILEILRENARTPYVEIAKQVGLTDVAIIKRIKRLESRGIIKKYTVIVDPSKLGYRAVSITGINIDPTQLFNVVQELRSRNYVKYLALTSGDHSLIAVIWARDRVELEMIHRDIERIRGVLRVYPAIVTDVVKEDCVLTG
jgi:Lrp/AsnC family transcriptional regulator for asnA, asnC and gidA